MTLPRAALIDLVLTIFGVLGGAPVERQPISGSPFEYDANGDQRVGALACWPGPRPVLYTSPALTPEEETHEYVHAADCADDGVLNGSPCAFTRPKTYTDALLAVHRARPDVLNSAAVWYAWAGTMGDEPVDTANAEWCAVISVLTGSLQPPADWVGNGASLPSDAHLKAPGLSWQANSHSPWLFFRFTLHNIAMNEAEFEILVAKALDGLLKDVQEKLNKPNTAKGFFSS